MKSKVPYVCGPLTELALDDQEKVKRFYQKVGNLCEEVLGVRAFVPHEHYDPIKNANFSPQEVYRAEQHQVCNLTSLLVVIAVEPSWGGGMEVEMANQRNIPVILLCEKEKLEARRISRLLRGSPAVKETISYSTEKEALEKLRSSLKNF